MKMNPGFDIFRAAHFIAPDILLGRMPRALLLAYSGGADSSLLLHLLNVWCRENGVRLYAAHVNHSIRGQEAVRDRDFCIKSAEEAGVRCFVLDADVPTQAREQKKGLEETAREIRYDFFCQVMQKENVDVLVTAHNADDNLETLIFRLARGSGAKGLCGIPQKRELGNGMVAIRPILSAKKEEILDICGKLDIKYVCDSTNTDCSYSRNRIRQNVVPQLRQLNPSVHASAVRLASNLALDCDFIDGEAKKHMSSPNFDRIDRLKSLHPALLKRVLEAMIRPLSDGMTEDVHFRALIELVRDGKAHSSVSLPSGIEAVIDFDRLVFRKAAPPGPSSEGRVQNLAPIPLNEGENGVFGGYVIDVHTNFDRLSQENHKTQENIYTLFTQVYLSSDKIVGKLYCRCRRHGDKIKRGGISKDVRQLMSELKIPLSQRNSYPIVCDDNGILWIPNVALRDGVKASEKENAVLLSASTLPTTN